MSLFISERNQELPASLHGMYAFLTEQEREDKLIELLAEILRKKVIAKIDEHSKPDGTIS